MIYSWEDDDEPGLIAEQEAAQDDDRRAFGLVPCSGCGDWMPREEVAAQDGNASYCGDCAEDGP